MCIWMEYGKEMEQKHPGVTRLKSFRYPAIIPVVYYEGESVLDRGQEIDQQNREWCTVQSVQKPGKKLKKKGEAPKRIK